MTIARVSWPSSPSSALAAAPAPRPQISDGIIKIGVLNDQSSLYADLAGQGSVLAARMAVEDFGADEEGPEGRDHLRRPPEQARRRLADRAPVVRRRQGRRDRRRAELRRWRSPSTRSRATRARRFLVSGGGLVRPHRQGVLAQHGPLDLRHLDARQRHRQRDREDGRRHLVLHHRRLRVRPRARARHRGGGAQERRQGAGQGAPPAQHRRTSRRSCCRRRPRRPRSSASPTPAATPSTRSSRRPSSASSRAARTSPACWCSSPTCTASGWRPRRA